ncbi:hypothetical protein BDC45DRAFT_541272 [Circinella umbellata]|nr:hypothetical protein BDC45DRAFT_541272 [Circinella umbellata]
MSTHEQVIEVYILDNKTESLSLANFVADNKELIVSTITSNRDFREYWSLLFKTITRKNGISMVSSSPDWASVCFLYVTNSSFTSDHQNAITKIIQHKQLRFKRKCQSIKLAQSMLHA